MTRMRKFAFDITLHVEEFEAASIEEAEEILNGYIDRLAETEDDKIRWGSLNITEIDTGLA
jgi:hypothetical protein